MTFRAFVSFEVEAETEQQAFEFIQFHLSDAFINRGGFPRGEVEAVVPADVLLGIMMLNDPDNSLDDEILDAVVIEEEEDVVDSSVPFGDVLDASDDLDFSGTGVEEDEREASDTGVAEE